MERIAPAGDVYQAGTLSGNPLAVAAGRATLELLDEQAYLDSRTDASARRRAARGAGDRPVSSRHDRAADRLLRRRAADDYAGAAPATPRPTAPGAARCSPAASTRRRRSSRPGSRRSRTPASTSSAPSRRPPRRSPRSRDAPLARLAEAAAEEGRAAGRDRDGRRATARSPTARPGPGAARTTRCSSRRSARAISSTTPPAAWCGPTIRTSRCSPATASTRSASPGSPRSATSRPSPSWPT